MSKETVDLDLVQYTVQSPYVKKQPPPWSLPLRCACCGDEAQGHHTHKVEYNSGNTRWWVNTPIPYCGVCMEHVGARVGQAKGAKALGFIIAGLAGVIAFMIWWQMEGDSFGEAVERLFALSKWVDLGICIALVAIYVGAEALLNAVGLKAGGEALPRTDNCTIAPLMKMDEDKFRMITNESKLVLEVTCGNPDFAREFEELNKELILDKVLVRGTAKRTPRGDLVLDEFDIFPVSDKLEDEEEEEEA